MTTKQTITPKLNIISTHDDGDVELKLHVKTGVISVTLEYACLQVDSEITWKKAFETDIPMKMIESCVGYIERTHDSVWRFVNHSDNVEYAVLTLNNTLGKQLMSRIYNIMKTYHIWEIYNGQSGLPFIGQLVVTNKCS